MIMQSSPETVTKDFASRVSFGGASKEYEPTGSATPPRVGEAAEAAVTTATVYDFLPAVMLVVVAVFTREMAVVRWTVALEPAPAVPELSTTVTRVALAASSTHCGCFSSDAMKSSGRRS
jgi:hypothetical protein